MHPMMDALTLTDSPAPLLLQLDDEAATARLGAALAELTRPRDVIALRGSLGAGKTVFARGFIRALGGGPEVPSPTFTLVQAYDVDPAAVWHFDLYRLQSPDEAYELGIEEAFSGSICLIEWPERLGALLPADRLDVTLEFGEGETRRRATLEAHGSWRDRLKGVRP
jgi:tRNA threonylcarbamoyladenosine biosynthesis protein TsaE